MQIERASTKDTRTILLSTVPLDTQSAAGMIRWISRTDQDPQVTFQVSIKPKYEQKCDLPTFLNQTNKHGVYDVRRSVK